MQKLAMDSLCFRGSSTPCWVQEELRERIVKPTDSITEFGLEAQAQDAKHSHQNTQPKRVAFTKKETKSKSEVHRISPQEEKVSIVSCKRQESQDDISVAVALVASLKACAKQKDLARGSLIHQDVTERGLLKRNVFVGSAVVSMFAKCGALDKAQEVFDELQVCNIVSWNALIAGYSQHGQSEKALCLFDRMQHDGFFPDAVTFACVLKACGHIGALEKGQNIHAQIRREHLLESDIVVGTALVDMYGKFGELEKAQEVFDKLTSRNVISWNSLISGYVQHGYNEQALDRFEWMQLEGFSPDTITFVSMLKVCGSLGDSEKGQELHLQIVRDRLLEKHIMVANALIDMYARCGEIERAQDVFNHLPKRSIVSWTVLISGYAQHGHGEEALHCFEMMKQSGFSPDAVTFVCVLKACTGLKDLEKGKTLHAEIEKEHLLEKHVEVANALVNMYAKCGALEKAQEVFDELPVQDLVSWNVLIAGYVDHGYGKEALICFEQMQLQGFCPSSITFACILKACGSTAALDKGKEIHTQIEKEHLLEKDVMVSSALVDMYFKCGVLEKAQEVFDILPVRNTILWNVLIAGYAHADRGEEALQYFEQMQLDGFCPNAVTFACALKACGSIGAAYKGQNIHAEIVRRGYPENGTVIGIELVVMYSKCGMLAVAQELFEKLPVQDAVMWSAMLVGYAQLGKDEIVLKLFDKMIGEGIVPNSVMFTIILNACNHLGLLDKGQLYFEIISKGYNIIPTLEHHTCMVDLFGRAGLIDKAVAVIEEIPLSADLTMWLALLGGCQKSGNRELANWAFKNAVHLNMDDASAYVHIRNLLLTAGRQEEADRIEGTRTRLWEAKTQREMNSSAFGIKPQKCVI